jgi:prepilin peptidase CpaA
MTFPVAMACAAATDLFTMKIPNRISLVLIAGFVVAAVLMRMPLSTFGLHLLVAFAVLAANFALFWKNMLGGGDAKLMAAGALWIGPFHAIEYLAYVTIFGGALALAILSYRNYVSANAFSLPQWALRLHKPGGGIPYGIAIAAGGLTVFPATEIFRALV